MFRKPAISASREMRDFRFRGKCGISVLQETRWIEEKKDRRYDERVKSKEVQSHERVD